MMSSKQVFYTINSIILVVVVAIIPSYHITAQEENEENDPLIILTSIKNLLQKSITELNKGNYTGASELVDIAYIDNYEYIENLRKNLAGLQKAREASNSPLQIQRYNKLIDEQNAKLKTLTTTANTHTKKTTSGFNDMKAGVTQLAGAMGIAFGVQKIIAFGKASLEASASFEKAMSELSSITGVVGADLEFYKQQAKELSVASFAGVNVTASAEEIAKAFSLVGSAMPALLGSKEAMVEVTKQAIILSEASGLTLPDAVKNLTDTMNQFGAPAADAAKYTDALAAGAKYGSATIPEVSEAMLKFGVAAKSAGVNVIETTALIETLASKGLKGAEAGTALRNILSKLANAKSLPKEAIDKFKEAGINMDLLQDKAVPLEDRLKEMSKILAIDGGLVKVFGEENQVAARALLENVGLYSEFTKVMGEVGVATEQAGINTDNTASKMKQFNNQIALIKISLGDDLAPTLLDVATGLSTLLKGDTSASGIDKMGEAFDRWFVLLKYIPTPLSAIIKGIKDFKSAFESFRDGNILEGFSKYFQGFANLVTLGIFGTIRGFVIGTKKVVVEGLNDIEKATLQAATMTDGELRVALDKLAASGKYTKEQLSELAAKMKKDQLTETFLLLSKALAITDANFKELTIQTDKYGVSSRVTAQSILAIKDATDLQLLAAFERQKLTINATKEDWDKYVATIQGFKTKAEESAIAQAELDKKILEGGKTVTEAAGPYDTLTASIGALQKKMLDYITLGKDATHLDRERFALQTDKNKIDSENTHILNSHNAILATRNALISMEIVLGPELSLTHTKTLEELKKESDELLKQALLRIKEADADAEGDEEKKKRKTDVFEIIQGINAAASNFLHTLMDEELRAAGDNKKKKKQIRKKYAIPEFLIKTSEIVANTAVAITQAFAQLGPIAGGIASGFIAATGAIQFGIASGALSKVLSLAEGTERVTGGEKGKDSVHALLMPDEAVIKADKNMANPGLSKAWNSGHLEDYIISNWVAPALKQQEAKRQETADNLAASMLLQQGQSFDDFRLFRASSEQISLLRKNNQLLENNLRKKNPWAV